LSFLGWAWWFSGIFWGGIWFIYSILLETIFGGTVGKKIGALRVVAIDRNLDVVHTVVRNLPKIFPLILLIDVLVGAAQQGDPRQRLFDRIARTTVTRVDQGAYMEEQFRMMQHAGPHPMTMPPAPAPQAPPPAPPGAQPAPARDVIRHPPNMRARRRNDVKTIAATTGRRSSTECVEGRRIPITPKVRRVVTTLAPIPSPRTRSVYPRRVAWYAAAMSGNEVPRATSVIPTNQGLSPATAESEMAPWTRN